MEYKFCCKTCSFNTNARSNYDIHKKTKKHTKLNDIQVTLDVVTIDKNTFPCEKCAKRYSTRAGLWKHTRTCTFVDVEEIKVEITEMKNMLADIKNRQSTNINNIQTNLNNNTNTSTSNSTNTNFNVNVFLNENFKPVKGFLETLNSIQIEKGYKEIMTKNGYVKTLCDMLKMTFDQIPITERPIYCIKNEDANQQILHIRHNDEWKRETELEWTDQIHNYYGGEASDDMPDEQKKLIFFGLKQMEDNVYEQIKLLYGKTALYKTFERETTGEMNYVPNKFKIIKTLIDYVNVEKPELLSIIEDAYEETDNTIMNENETNSFI